MKGSKKLQREISDFVQKCRQKDAAKQAANYPTPLPMRGKMYDNSLWSHLFFESSSQNTAANRASKSRNA
jgi:hypothetical protein